MSVYIFQVNTFILRITNHADALKLPNALECSSIDSFQTVVGYQQTFLTIRFANMKFNCGNVIPAKRAFVSK